MEYLQHLSGRQDADEKELIGLVTNMVTNSRTPSGAHIRDVLFVLTSADFLHIKKRRLSLTGLGRLAYANICDYDSNPPVTTSELEGYRTILRSHDIRMSVFKVLHPNSRLSEQLIVKLVEAALKEEGKLSISVEKPINALLLTMGSTKLIKVEGDSYSLTELGRSVCQDLGVMA